MKRECMLTIQIIFHTPGTLNNNIEEWKGDVNWPGHQTIDKQPVSEQLAMPPAPTVNYLHTINEILA